MPPRQGSVRAFMRENAAQIDAAARRAIQHLEVTPDVYRTHRLVKELRLDVDTSALGARLARAARDGHLVKLGSGHNRRWVHRNFAHVILQDRSPGVA